MTVESVDPQSICGPVSVADERPAVARWSEASLKARLKQLAPFHHAIALPFRLNTYDRSNARHDRERTRMNSLKAHLWPRMLAAFGGTLSGKRVLDIACNCGGFSFEAAASGAKEVLGIDVDAHYIEQANFVRDVLDTRQVSFAVGRLEEIDPNIIGRFDIVFFFGILYHLPDPLGGLQRVANLTDDMLIVDASMLRFRLIDRFVKLPIWAGKRVKAMRASDEDYTTGRWRTSDSYQFYPNCPAVIDALKFVGFPDVTALKPRERGLEARYYRGKRVTFIARRPRAVADGARSISLNQSGRPSTREVGG